MLALLFASLYLVKEAQTRLSREEVLRSVQGLGEAFKSPTLWKMALILFFTQFAPNAGVAWYTYETETLKIPQDAVGIEGAIGSIGGILGAILFNWKLSHVPPRRLLAMSLCASAAGTLCYLLVRGVSTLYPVAFIVGVLAMVALLSLLSLAGEACPKRAEGFTFAALMGLNNLAVQWGTQIGARIFDGTGKIIWPLILVSAGTTLLALIFLPLLPKTNVTPRADKEEDR
jgi:predicted MFS family arabinose efflux permease